MFINQGVNIFASQLVSIGDFVKIADFAAISDSGFHPVSPGEEVLRAPVIVERNVWIGRNALIMPGVTVGQNSVIAAGAVVTRSVPRDCVVAGVPAIVVRQFAAPSEDWVRP